MALLKHISSLLNIIALVFLIITGTKPIVSSQMSEILLWTTEFRERHDAPGEHVTFDILCGDFNIDNMSPGMVNAAGIFVFKAFFT